MLSTEDKSHQAFADAIRQLTEATVSDARLSAALKHEVVEALASIAKNAESGEGKPTVVTKALISWLPTVLTLSADAITLWDKFGPTVRAFFNL